MANIYSKIVNTPRKEVKRKTTKAEKEAAREVVAGMARFSVADEWEEGVWKTTIWQTPTGHRMEVQNRRFGWDEWYDFPLESGKFQTMAEDKQARLVALGLGE